MHIVIKTPIPRDYKTVFSMFNLKLFEALKPPLVKLEVTRFDGCNKGDEVHLKVSGTLWVSHITDFFESPEEIYFVDVGATLPPPLTFWKHTHRIQKTGEQSSMVIDDIHYSTGNTFIDNLIYPAIYAMFVMRRPIYKRELS